MEGRMLSDTQWSRIAELLPAKPPGRGGRVADNRRFVEAILFIAREGCPWRDLPKEFGKWNSVYVRFSRWENLGVWARIAEALRGEVDQEEFSDYAAIVRAHQDSAGTTRKRVAIRRLAARVAD